MADFTQTWNNKSSTPFFRVDYSAKTDRLLGNTVHTEPGPVLDAAMGKQSLCWSETGSTLAAGFDCGYIIWRTEDSSFKFGININVPPQMFKIGPAPYYQVKINDGQWEGCHKTEPYQIPTPRLKYNIEIKSVADHSTLYVSVDITDKVVM